MLIRIVFVIQHWGKFGIIAISVRLLILCAIYYHPIVPLTIMCEQVTAITMLN